MNNDSLSKSGEMRSGVCPPGPVDTVPAMTVREAAEAAGISSDMCITRLANYFATLEALAARQDELRRLKNLGRKSIAAARAILAHHGLGKGKRCPGCGLVVDYGPVTPSPREPWYFRAR